MAELRKTMVAPPRTAWRAVLISLALHASLLLLFFLLGQRPPHEGQRLDSRVTVSEAFLLRFDSSSPRPGRKSRGPDLVEVRVEQAPATPGSSPTGPGPSVDIKAMPGVRSLPSGESGVPGTTRGGARFFGAAVGARRVVFVIDRSLSMGPSGAFAAARAQLSVCLSALPPSTRFQVVFYNVSADALPSTEPDGLLPADAPTLARVNSLLAAVCAEGNTDHVRALRCGLGFRPDVLFVVTDADDLTPFQVREVTQLNQGHTVIHAVDVDDQHRGAEMLGQLARNNGGSYFCPRQVARH